MIQNTLPLTPLQKEAVRAGQKEARAIIENSTTSLKQNVVRLSNLIDTVLEKYETLEKGFLDIADTSETYSRENKVLKAENERLRQLLKGTR